jgi:hypothetical protein
MTSPLRRKHPTTAPSTRWATPLEGLNARLLRGAVRPVALVLSIGLALSLPATMRADGGSPQWSKARKGREVASAAQGQTDAAGGETAGAPNKLKWRKPGSAVSPPSGDIEHAAGTTVPKESSMIVLATATAPVNESPIKKAFADDKKASQEPPKIRLLAVDEDEGELVPIAADDEDQGDKPASEESSEELPVRRKRRPAEPTDIDTSKESEMSIDDEFAMGPTADERACPTVKDSIKDGGFRRMNEITNRIEPEGDQFPRECPLGGDPYEPRKFAMTTFTWRAAALCHKPLYFEDVQLERYGHTYGPVLQPCISAAHFFASVPLMPYKMGVEPPLECVYALGYYRPGSCAPRTIGPIPISVRGTVSQLGISTGLVYLFP